MTTTIARPAVSFRKVDIVFGPNPKLALDMLDAGATRSEILEKTNHVLGAADASIDVAEGEICVLMGLSGSGKSTLLRAVNGLNRPSRGSVLVTSGGLTTDVANCPPATLRELRMKTVSMVFQSFALLPWRTVAENVGLGLELAGVPVAERKERVDKQLKLVGLDQWASKFGHELSGGMQQRVGLARAFATEAPILLMDEPFSALDPLIRTKLQDELLELQRKLKKTIVFVSHDLEEALKLGNRIVILEGGHVVQSAAPEEIILRPANDYVREFVANVNPLSVLTAYNVMRDVRDLETGEPGWIWLDRRKTTAFQVQPDGKVAAGWRDGKPTAWVSCDELDKPRDPAAATVYWARPDTPLKIVMQAIHSSDVAPVALFNAEDQLVGAIGVRDVLGAVLRRGN
jgi:glycine betaine/proline transport system ATP-binding protein